MIPLSEVPAGCVRVTHYALRHVMRGITHGPIHHHIRRVPKRHAALAHHAHHPVVHAPAWHGWSEIVCRAVGTGLAAAGAAGLGYGAGQAAQAIYTQPPAQVAQAAPGGFGGGGYGSGGWGFSSPPSSGFPWLFPQDVTSVVITPGELTPPSDTSDTGLPPAGWTEAPSSVPPVPISSQPQSVPEPAGFAVLLVGLTAAIAITLNKKVRPPSMIITNDGRR